MTLDTPDSTATMEGTQTTIEETQVEPSPKVSVRFPQKLYDACVAKAGKLSIGKWIRTLAEDATGVKVPIVHGLAGSDDETKARVSSLGGLQKAANARKQRRKKRR